MTRGTESHTQSCPGSHLLEPKTHGPEQATPLKVHRKGLGVFKWGAKG